MTARKAPTVVEDAELKEPADLRKALKASPEAHALWKTLTRIARRDFIRWITSAKQAEARAPDRQRVRHALRGEAASVLLRHEPVEDAGRPIEVQESGEGVTSRGGSAVVQLTEAVRG
ncbi:YdeI/OmpD-associated family protein [Nannocystis sp. ILAH1]|uniref:YdeI/OmpD-associated family protein n=1 Tax=Nannocystis sp. ILAH1 TaxID=2996789 RepID=UPI00226D8C95|nr:YdeI/OmpD-associated family protein [Nannocystis sp. ILAH1]MCY0989487.1 YdeI/OmpD-associated family protein [Nannocystis sp. ILAH1]